MLESSAIAGATAGLTPRLDRIELALSRVLASGGTRSALREVVYQYADLHSLQGVPPERTLASLESRARRVLQQLPARHFAIPGESEEDRLAMIMRWCSARLHRVPASVSTRPTTSD